MTTRSASRDVWRSGDRESVAHGMREIKPSDQPFLDWLQQRSIVISDQELAHHQERVMQLGTAIARDHSILSRRMARILPQARTIQEPLLQAEHSLALAQQANAYVHSDEFRTRLNSWEPWRLDERSVREGRNAAVRIVRGYASNWNNGFLAWVRSSVESYNAAREAAEHVTEDMFIAGVIETIKRIEWETIRVMATDGTAKIPVLPFLTLGDTPRADVIMFSNALSRARGRAILGVDKDSGGLFDSKYARGGLFSEEEAAVKQVYFQQTMDKISGKLNLGAAKIGTDIIGLQEEMIMRWVDGEGMLVPAEEVIRVIAEEEIHHQGYKSEDMLAIRSAEISMYYGQDMWSLGDALSTRGDQIESQLGIHEYAARVASRIKFADGFFAPLERWAPGFVNN